jgi:hypothetical protein
MPEHRGLNAGGPLLPPQAKPEGAQHPKSKSKAQEISCIIPHGHLVTKKGDLYRVEGLYDLRRRGAVTALLVYGKGFSCRYDLGLAKKDGPTGK